MRDRLPLWCPRCGGHAHYTPGLISCTCGSAFDPGFPPYSGQAPGEGIWRLRDAVGSLDREASIGEGDTPLLEVVVGGYTLFLKAEYASPTGSYKDRGAAYCLSLLATLGADSVTEDSSGNAGAAYAAYAAALGLRCEVFVPEGAPGAKVSAIRRLGAEVTVVPGGRTAAHDHARSSPSYAGHGWAAPFLVGVGTIAYEIVEQCGGAPEEIILPVGQGGLLYGIFLGFRRMQIQGAIGALPALTGVQAQSCAPLYWAAELGSESLPKITVRPTMADAVRIERPVRWAQVLRAVEETGGQWLIASEEEILSARRSLAAIGHDVEPTSALPWAVIQRRARTREGIKDRTIVLLTGSGWKVRGGEGGKTA